jgi:predicted O-methyltransferase YrrM
MYSKAQLAARYFSYYLKASNGKGHGMHSPFVYEFIEQVLNDERDFYAYTQIEKLRQQLVKDKRVIEVQDMGAGSASISSAQRRVAAIASSSVKPAKYAQLLFRMVNYYQPKRVLELGTSLGVTTAYLASAGLQNEVITMEGDAAIAALARENFNRLALKNIELVEGNFDHTLSSVIQPHLSFDFIFIDGNHRKEPTLRYFEQLLPVTNNNTIFVFDDIHWSYDMEQAWQLIKKHPAVRCTIDLFFIGIVLLRKEFLEKQHFSIRF